MSSARLNTFALEIVIWTQIAVTESEHFRTIFQKKPKFGPFSDHFPKWSEFGPKVRISDLVGALRSRAIGFMKPDSQLHRTGYYLGTEQLNLNKPSTSVSFLAHILPRPPSCCLNLAYAPPSSSFYMFLAPPTAKAPVLLGCHTYLKVRVE